MDSISLKRIYLIMSGKHWQSLALVLVHSSLTIHMFVIWCLPLMNTIGLSTKKKLARVLICVHVVLRDEESISIFMSLRSQELTSRNPFWFDFQSDW